MTNPTSPGKAEELDLNDYVFRWFNDLYPDEMASCLNAYDERAKARAHTSGEGQ